MFIWQKDSLLPELNQHQGVFWPDHPNTKEYFGQTKKTTDFKSAFLCLKIALSLNLIGSSDVNLHMDSESGLNSKITKESFRQTTVELLIPCVLCYCNQ